MVYCLSRLAKGRPKREVPEVDGVQGKGRAKDQFHLGVWVRGEPDTENHRGILVKSVALMIRNPENPSVSGSRDDPDSKFTAVSGSSRRPYRSGIQKTLGIGVKR